MLIPSIQNVLIACGWFTARIVGLTVNDTTDAGKYLRAIFEILNDGPYKGERVTAFFNIEDVNPTRRAIAIHAFFFLVQACGMADMPKDTDELIGKTVRIYVDQYVDKNGIGRNCVKSYLAQSSEIGAESTPEDTGEDDPF